MEPKDENSNFLRLLKQAILDKQRDKTEILHLARQLMGANDYVEEMSDPVVLRAVHLYRKCNPQHGQAPVPLPALIHFLRTRRGLQQVDGLERRLGKIRKILISMGPIDVTQRMLVNPWDILAMRVLAGIEPLWDDDLPDEVYPKNEDRPSSTTAQDTND